MKSNGRHILFGILPILLAAIFFGVGLKINVEKLLTLFLPVVWGIMVALGGGIVFLKKYDFGKQPGQVRNYAKLNKKVTSLALILLIQTLAFLVLSLFFPAHDYIRTTIKHVDWFDSHWGILSNGYNSLLFSFIVCPSILSVIVGMWTVYLALNDEKS